MTDRSRSLDEQIRQAIQRGEFDDLPGKGKPLDLSENPHEDPSWSTAYRMLRSGGYTLPWIETRQNIEKEFQTACEALTRSWEWWQLRRSQPGSVRQAKRAWENAVERFREAVTALNKRIFNYNLEVPANQFQRRQINADAEIARITA